MPKLEETTRRYTVARYPSLVDGGIPVPDDRLELLAGVIVETASQDPQHASATRRVSEVLREPICRRR